MCSKCETLTDMNVDCEECGNRAHVFWQVDIGKFIDYLRQSRSFADKIFVISHNSRGYDAQFLLRRFLELRWVPKLIMDGTNILSLYGTYTFYGFSQFLAYVFEKHAQII
jgi:hypothetical protein